jgi:GNAT superfamily N-acetyltransferase
MNTTVEIDVAHVTPIVPTFRTAQVAGMFDLPADKNSVEHFHAELPTLESDWQIGIIVGPSGSGKTSIARKAFTAKLYEPAATAWDAERAVIDAFPETLSIKQITATLTAVGFSSPPSWLKPYHVLSGGERFRCDLARALLTESEHAVTVFDEFTSVVDRTVAKVASAALAKGIRKERFLARKFVAVSCHYDIIPWLCPDWILDTATFELARGRLQRRPPIDLTLHPAVRTLWDRFKRHHYLNTKIHPSSRCYVARWNGEPVTFVSTLPQLGRKACRRIHRLVTLPDYQGIGLGTAVLEAVCHEEASYEQRITLTTSHPALLGYCHQSPHWHTTRFAEMGFDATAKTPGRRKRHTSRGRPVATFTWKSSPELRAKSQEPEECSGSSLSDLSS